MDKNDKDKLSVSRSSKPESRQRSGRSPHSTSKRLSPKDRMTSTQVIRLQKFARSQIEAIGDFATGLTHEINQPLTVINGVLGYLASRIDAGRLELDKARELIGNAQGEVKRISHLLDRLYEFGAGNVGPREWVDLRMMIDELLEIMGRRLLSFSMELSLTFSDDLPPVFGDKAQLKQGFLYLFDNAVESMEKTNEGPKRVAIEAGVDDSGENVVLRFSDNGVGVDDLYLDKIFEPFFTTKSEGNTPGLGLSILYSIIKNHNGVIRCLPKIKKGAVFELTLPCRAKNAMCDE